ncbi:MAG: asparagine synthase-related protein [Armatimonadota bacterium]
MDEDLALTQLRRILSQAIAKQATMGKEVACWLSGGLDSSTIAILARQQLGKLMTFSIGFKDAPDLTFAREVANSLGTRHNEVIITPEQVIESLPATIYHLESFDAPLVRSAVANFLLAKVTSCHADSVLSGEGADEIFGGYQYFQDIDTRTLASVLADAINNLHNTALQRIDRCAAAFGLMVLTPFLNNQMLDYVLSLPVEYKVRRNGRVIGKWILRKAVENALPHHILNREKAKFWEGTGITQLIARYAEDIISDQELYKDHILPDGSILRSKEELLYFRIFKEQFGEVADLSFVGRTSYPEPKKLDPN